MKIQTIGRREWKGVKNGENLDIIVDYSEATNPTYKFDRRRVTTDLNY